MIEAKKLIIVSSILWILTVTHVGLLLSCLPSYPTLPVLPLNRGLHRTWFESHWLLRILSRLARMIRRKHLKHSQNNITITVIIIIAIIFRKH